MNVIIENYTIYVVLYVCILATFKLKFINNINHTLAFKDNMQYVILYYTLTILSHISVYHMDIFISLKWLYFMVVSVSMYIHYTHMIGYLDNLKFWINIIDIIMYIILLFILYLI